MDITFLLKGIALGFSIAAPVGPISVLCIRRTLTKGAASGLATGLGTATADALYGAVAAFGLTLISSVLVEQTTWLRLIGGGFLCYLGIAAFCAKPTHRSSFAAAPGVPKSYLSGLLLTLTNPMTILSFAAVFAWAGIADVTRDSLAPALLVLGTFVGSALWWLVLTSSISLFRARFNERSLYWLNRGSGVVLIAFGISSLCSLPWWK